MATTARIDEHMIMQRREEARRLKEVAVLRRAVPVGHNLPAPTTATTARPQAVAQPQPHPQSGSVGCQGQPTASAATTAVDPRQLRRVMSGRANQASSGGTVRSNTLNNPKPASSVASPTNRIGSVPVGGACGNPAARGPAPRAVGPRSYSGGEIGNASDKAVAAAEEQQKLRISARQLRGVGLPAATPTSPTPRRATYSPDRKTAQEREATKHSDFADRMFLRAQLRGTPSVSNTATAQPAAPQPPVAAPGQPASRSQQSAAGSPSFKSLRASTGRVPSPVINNAPIRNSRLGNGAPLAMNASITRQMGSRPGTPDVYIPPRPASACSYTSSSSFTSQVMSPTETQRPRVAAVPRPATSTSSQPLAPKPSSPVKPTSVKAYSPWEAGDAVHALRAARKKLGKEAFIEYVYTNHPPKDPSKKLNPKLDVKKQMQRALSHYHPDKQNMQEHGPEWCLICEEVCKEITRMYKKRASPH